MCLGLVDLELGDDGEVDRVGAVCAEKERLRVELHVIRILNDKNNKL